LILARRAFWSMLTNLPMIRDENGQLAGYVYVDTAMTDIGGYVHQAKRAINKHLKLPTGYPLLWTGEGSPSVLRGSEQT
jgi:Cu(I)/Ag(I) efflux system membrane protein CusA/SilA